MMLQELVIGEMKKAGIMDADCGESSLREVADSILAILSLVAEDRRALVTALRRARADFAGPVAKLCEMTNTHPFTLAIGDIDAALAKVEEPPKEEG